MKLDYDFEGWVKLGLVYGLFWTLIYALLGAVLGAVIGSFVEDLTPGIYAIGSVGVGTYSITEGAIVGGTAGLALGIAGLMATLIRALAGGFIADLVKLKNEFWRVALALWSGGALISIMTGRFSTGTVDMIFWLLFSVTSAIAATWIVMWIYKKLNWKAPK